MRPITEFFVRPSVMLLLLLMLNFLVRVVPVKTGGCLGAGWMEGVGGVKGRPTPELQVIEACGQNSRLRD